MKFTEKFLLKSSGYTVVILTLLYIFAMITNLIDASIDFPAFSLVFCFSCVISLSELIFKTYLKFIWKLSIHYSVLMVSFLTIFMASGKLHMGGSSVIFSAIVIFTAFYFTLFAVIRCTKKVFGIIDGNLLKHSKSDSNTKRTKNEYKPLYKD